MFLFSVGGIYTVIKTKAAVTVEELGEQYFLIGPYNESCVRTEVEIVEPQNEACSKAIRQMRESGIKVGTHILFLLLPFPIIQYHIICAAHYSI